MNRALGAGGAAIVARDLRRSFGSTQALKGVSLAVPAGTVLGVLGPNGAGKTTLIRILATLLPPGGGQALVAGHDVVRESFAVRSRIGLTGQYAALDEQLSGRENLRLIGRLYHLGERRARRRADELLALVDLEEAAGRSVGTYSGGMRRRVDIAAGLVAAPAVLFLDEPTTGLDPRSRIDVWNVIEGLVRQGTTLLLTTQHLEEADRLADTIAVMDAGRIIAEGTPDDLKRQVGGDVLELRLRDQRQAAAAFVALQPLAAGAPRHEDEVLAVPLRGAEGAVVEAVRRLDAAEVGIVDVGVRRPTLDDVFLTLTGQPAEAEAQAEEVA
ncbi:MAG TPA: ATP-binding cassette domain-containing protein [Candidatus Dormibacteraeota bacterium]|nr:ATP-binding cassette domain-containing protein [Candidatus Dormibacteraeota bacterium]